MSDTPLRAAVRHLPTYDPPAAVWDGLESRLHLHAGLTGLPAYEPPAAVWEKLDMALTGAAQRQPARLSARWINRLVVRVAAAALVLAVLGTVAFFRSTPTATDRVAVSFTQELAQETPAPVLPETPAAEAEARQLVETFCQLQAEACSTPEFASLKTEFDRLDEACSALREALDVYGDDPALRGQLGALERARADVLKNLVRVTLS